MSSEKSNTDVERLTLFLQGHSENDAKANDSSDLEMIKLKLEMAALEIDLENVVEERNKLEDLICNDVSSQVQKLFHSPGDIDIQKVEKEFLGLEKQIKYLDTSNKALNKTISKTRGQMTELYNNLLKKADEVDVMETTLQLVRSIQTTEDKDLESMKKEIEKLKTQKEDIVNHSKNSEKLFTQRIAYLTSEVERLNVRDLKQASADEVAENIRKLEKQLEDTLKNLQMKDIQVQLLEQRVSHETNLKLMSEKQVEYNQMLVAKCWEDSHAYVEERKEYQFQITNLAEEIKGLEEMATAMRAKFEEVTEKLDKQTITFSNEKAKFCHDLERVEEKWNNEVVKLHKKNEALIKSKKEDFARFSQMKEEDEKDKTELRAEIESLKEEIESVQEEAEKTNASTIEQWDEECEEFEKEVYDLIASRRVAEKETQKYRKKNRWLSRCIKELAQQRRDELEVMKAENKTLTDRCELLRKEKVEWLTDLKREVNAWKDETSERMALEQRIEELEKENEELEEKVDDVTEKWRSECEVYEATMSMIHDERVREIEEFRERLRLKAIDNEALKETICRLETAQADLEITMEQQKATSCEVLQQAVRSGRAAINRVTANNEYLASVKEEENRIAQKNLQKLIDQLKNTLNDEKQKVLEANVSISNWQQKVQDIADSRATLIEEVCELKEKNDELRENMGVEVLDTSKSSEESDESESDSDDSDDSDDSSDESGGECTCGMCETDDDDEEDRMYDDMPTLKREEEKEKPVEKASESKKKESSSEEWELVDDEDKDEEW